MIQVGGCRRDRGDFIGRCAALGLWCPGNNQTFESLPPGQEPVIRDVESRCGLPVVDIDVVLACVTRPGLIGFQGAAIKMIIKPEQAAAGE